MFSYFKLRDRKKSLESKQQDWKRINDFLETPQFKDFKEKIEELLIKTYLKYEKAKTLEDFLLIQGEIIALNGILRIETNSRFNILRVMQGRIKEMEEAKQ